ncbi:hypothetical protein RIF29_42121 [Crotalaria pallida]|uniref:Uncharacterized protein n=1 Tax=Crotalaria pallida TaxID=3830 RepID=A0AAN9E8K0_CROPI
MVSKGKCFIFLSESGIYLIVIILFFEKSTANILNSASEERLLFWAVDECCVSCSCWFHILHVFPRPLSFTTTALDLRPKKADCKMTKSTTPAVA